MSYVRISVTLDSEVAAELRRVVGRRGLSAFVNQAVRQRLQAVRVRKMLDQMEAEAGPVPEEDQQAVDQLDWPR